MDEHESKLITACMDLIGQCCDNAEFLEGERHYRVDANSLEAIRDARNILNDMLKVPPAILSSDLRSVVSRFYAWLIETQEGFENDAEEFRECLKCTTDSDTLDCNEEQELKDKIAMSVIMAVTLNVTRKRFDELLGKGTHQNKIAPTVEQNYTENSGNYHG